MLLYKIHQFDGKEFELSKIIPAYTKYCGYDYCIQEYNNQTFPIPVQNIFQFSEPAYLKDGYYRRYSKEFDLERTRNFRYFKNGEVYIQDSYSYVFEWGLSEYTRGFLEGYNENSIPVIDTSQARIEMIVKVATVRPEFVNIKTDNSRVVKMHCVYSQGLKEGRRYKAWNFIEQTPGVFVNYFIETTKTDQPTSPQPFAGLLSENKKSFPLLLKEFIDRRQEEQKEVRIRTQVELNLKTENNTAKLDTTPPKNIKITLPKIDESKFDTKWLYETYNNIVFKCSEECFNSWLKNGTQHLETIEFILKWRQGKPAIAQLRKFIETITGDAENTKDTYYKTVFGLKIKTAQLKTATNLNDIFKELKNKVSKIKLEK